jgi:small-conductance mechanosensitive channel
MRGAARRKSDRGEKDFRAMRSGISWEVIAIAALGLIVTLGGYVWNTNRADVETKIAALQVAAADDRKATTQGAVESAKTQEKVNNIEKKVDGVDKKVDELRGDLKELLRNQQQQIYQQQQRPAPAPMRPPDGRY